MQSFYDYYETASDVDMVDVDIHSFRATDLSPETQVMKLVSLQLMQMVMNLVIRFQLLQQQLRHQK